jgi:hypothetical protein
MVFIGVSRVRVMSGLTQNQREDDVSLKFAVMVEPFNKSGSSSDYAGIYDHVYDDFVVPFSSIYYNASRPLICFFNDENLTDDGAIPIDGRFDTVLVGSHPTFNESTLT